jgi:hypothetical protein
MCSAYFVSCYGGKSLKHEFTPQQRKRIKAKMAEVFKENLAGLSTEFQKILLDDLVTALQNRINVLKRVQAKRAANGD